MDNIRVAISMFTTAPGLLKYIGVANLDRGVKTVSKRSTWEQVLFEEYGISVAKDVFQFISVAKFGKSHKKNGLKNKVAKFIGQFKTKTSGTYSVRLIISSQIKTRAIPSSRSQSPLEAIEPRNAEDEETVSVDIQELPPYIEMEIEIEDDVKPVKKEEVPDSNDFEIELNEIQEDSQVEEDDTNNERPLQTLENPFLQGHSQLEMPTTPETRYGSALETLESKEYSAPATNLEHRRNTGNSQPDLQDDNESVFTTMPQAQLQGRDIEMLNKLRAKMNSFPDAVVLKMYEEMTNLPERVWQRWMVRAPMTTGFLRQSFV